MSVRTLAACDSPPPIICVLPCMLIPISRTDARWFCAKWYAA